MNDIEKAISYLEFLQEQNNTPSIDIKLSTAIQTLKKQVPIKPNEDSCCPICLTYSKDDNGVEGNYCPNCGQKLDWSEDDE